MKRFLVLTTLLTLISFSSQASMTVSQAWVRASHGQTSAAFMKLQNTSNKEVSLIKAEADCCDLVELHTTLEENGVYKMRPVEKISVTASSEQQLKPGSYHVMLIGLRKKLSEGETVPLTLTFSDGTTQKVEAGIHIGKPCCQKKMTHLSLQ